jgi:hypothetical protein
MLQGGVPDANETTDYTDATDVKLGSARGSRADWKAWPLLRIRCGSGVAETIMASKRAQRNYWNFPLAL